MSSRTWIAACAVAAVAALASCASRPPEHLYKTQQYKNATKAAEAGGDPSKIMICEQSMVTGSHIPTKRCWSKLELDVAREKAQRDAADAKRLDR